MPQLLVIDNGSIHIQELLSLLQKHEEYKTKVITSPQIDSIINSIKNHEFNLIILSGSTNSVMANVQKYSKEIELIKSTNVPIIGICLGFELVAYSFGCNLTEMHSKEEGVLKIDVLEEDKIFEGRKFFNVFEAHRWVVTSLSEEVKGLAKSKDGYEIIKHKEKKIYGFQFHPEVIKENNEGKEILFNTFKLVLS